jgi:hypothetical protein|uniref:MULE transposase domain-containing protein n=1 Tax=Sipha flava TaxID=143950 RepID=A0A2S2QKW5_9HEMI
MDGTFSICPVFYLVYLLHENANINNIIIPAMYALLQRKNKHAYIELSAIRDQFVLLSIISIDFEKSVIQTIKEVFHDDLSVQLCYYHLNQSILRKVQDLDLAIKYKKRKTSNQP